MNPEASIPCVAERRAGDRIEVAWPSRIVAADGRACDATVRNISRGGVQVQLAAAHAVLLLPNTAREAPRAPVTVRLEFPLPAAPGAPAVAIDCGIAYLRRLAADESAMGLTFRRFHDGCEHALARFLAP